MRSLGYHSTYILDSFCVGLEENFQDGTLSVSYSSIKARCKLLET